MVTIHWMLAIIIIPSNNVELQGYLDMYLEGLIKLGLMFLWWYEEKLPS